MNFWTADNTAEAIRLWNKGKSGDQIAIALGASSRNVVLGKLFRMGFMKNPGRPKPGLSARNPFRRGASARSTKATKVPVAPPDLSIAVHILDTTALDRRCRFPLWDENEQSAFLFCGHKAANETTSYCAYHHRLCHGEGTRPERHAVSIRINTDAPETVADIAAEAMAAA